MNFRTYVECISIWGYFISSAVLNRNLARTSTLHTPLSDFSTTSTILPFGLFSGEFSGWSHTGWEIPICDSGSEERNLCYAYIGSTTKNGSFRSSAINTSELGTTCFNFNFRGKMGISANTTILSVAIGTSLHDQEIVWEVSNMTGVWMNASVPIPPGQNIEIIIEGKPCFRCSIYILNFTFTNTSCCLRPSYAQPPPPETKSSTTNTLSSGTERSMTTTTTTQTPVVRTTERSSSASQPTAPHLPTSDIETTERFSTRRQSTTQNVPASSSTLLVLVNANGSFSTAEVHTEGAVSTDIIITIGCIAALLILAIATVTACLIIRKRTIPKSRKETTLDDHLPVHTHQSLPLTQFSEDGLLIRTSAFQQSCCGLQNNDVTNLMNDSHVTSSVEFPFNTTVKEQNTKKIYVNMQDPHSLEAVCDATPLEKSTETNTSTDFYDQLNFKKLSADKQSHYQSLAGGSIHSQSSRDLGTYFVLEETLAGINIHNESSTDLGTYFVLEETLAGESIHNESSTDLGTYFVLEEDFVQPGVTVSIEEDQSKLDKCGTDLHPNTYPTDQYNHALPTDHDNRPLSADLYNHIVLENQTQVEGSVSRYLCNTHQGEFGKLSALSELQDNDCYEVIDDAPTFAADVMGTQKNNAIYERLQNECGDFYSEFDRNKKAKIIDCEYDHLE